MKSKCLYSVFVLMVVFILTSVGGITDFAQESLEEGDVKYDTTPYFQADDTGEVQGAML